MKRITSLYLDEHLVKLLRARGVNVSALVNDFLRQTVENVDREFEALQHRKEELEAELRILEQNLQEKLQQKEHLETLIDEVFRHMVVVAKKTPEWTLERLEKAGWGYITGRYPQLPRIKQTQIVHEARRRVELLVKKKKHYYK